MCEQQFVYIKDISFTITYIPQNFLVTNTLGAVRPVKKMIVWSVQQQQLRER